MDISCSSSSGRIFIPVLKYSFFCISNCSLYKNVLSRPSLSLKLCKITHASSSGRSLKKHYHMMTASTVETEHLIQGFTEMTMTPTVQSDNCISHWLYKFHSDQFHSDKTVCLVSRLSLINYFNVSSTYKFIGAKLRILPMICGNLMLAVVSESVSSAILTINCEYFCSEFTRASR